MIMKLKIIKDRVQLRNPRTKEWFKIDTKIGRIIGKKKDKTKWKNVLVHPEVCAECGVSVIPDKKSVRFGTKKWDGHTYKFPCKCMPKNLRVCSG